VIRTPLALYREALAWGTPGNQIDPASAVLYKLSVIDLGRVGYQYPRARVVEQVGTGPPDREALPGIAKLFGTTTDQVAAMIAADWYGVHPDTDISARALRLGPTLDQLAESDAELVERLAQRLVPA